MDEGMIVRVLGWVEVKIAVGVRIEGNEKEVN